jgi:hypothetical protein
MLPDFGVWVSITLVFINIVLCGVTLVCFGKLVKGYDTGNNLTNLSHQANSGDWQQTLGSFFGFALGGQIQSQCGLDCLGIHKHDTGNNLTNLSHQANSGDWQQTLTIHPNNVFITQN